MLLLLLGCPPANDKAPATDSSESTPPIDDSAPTLPTGRVLGSRRLGEAFVTVTGPETMSGTGKAAAACDLEGDGVTDLLVGAPDNRRGQGLVLVFRGPLAGPLTVLDADSLVSGTGTIDAMGTSTVCLGDRDGDGIQDIGLGAPKYDEARGAAFFFNGAALLNTPILAGEDATASVRGLQPNDQLGVEIGLAGDHDGDGRTEIFVSAWLADDGAPDAGALYLFGAVGGAVTPTSSLAGWRGIAEKDWAAYGVGAGQDLNADGNDDLFIGADGVDTPAAFAGAGYVVLGPFGGQRSLIDADAEIIGEQEDENGGHSVAMSPDLTGDGQPDLIIGGFGFQEWAGRVGIFSGSVSGRVPLSAATVTVAPADTGAYYGYSVNGPGDLDGDGVADLLVSARYDNTGGLKSGAAWLQYGPIQGDPDLDRDGAILMGDVEADEAGFIVVGVDDLDGDGLPDFAVGAPGNDAGGDNAGALYLWRGAP